MQRSASVQRTVTLLLATAGLWRCSGAPPDAESGPPGPAVTSSSASDDFERSTLGSNWTVYNGDVGIVNQRDLGMVSRMGPIAGLGIVTWTGTGFGADQFSEATISDAVHPDVFIQVFVRRRSSDKQRYGFHWQNKELGGEWVIKLDGATGAPVLKLVPAAEPLPGDVIRIEAVGEVIRGLHNGVEVVQFTDSVLTEAGEPGIAINTRLGGIPDEDFPVAAIASWRGGSPE